MAPLLAVWAMLFGGSTACFFRSLDAAGKPVFVPRSHGRRAVRGTVFAPFLTVRLAALWPCYCWESASGYWPTAVPEAPGCRFLCLAGR